MQAYAGMATAMDHETGRLVEYLRASGQYGNTVFVILSDNGATTAEPYDNAFARRWFEANYTHDVETLGEKGSWVAAGRGWGAVSNTPLAGSKFTASEGGVRVPLVIAGLPAITPGSVNGQFVYVTDLAPTLLDIAGVAVPTATQGLQPMTGTSLLPTLLGHPGPVHAPEEAIGYEFSGNAALYRGDYKLVTNRPPAGDGTWRLYRIGTDPGETTDLARQMPELYQQLQTDYAAYATAAGVLPMPDNYSLARQVLINALVFVYLPRYLPYILGALLLLVVVYLLRRRWRAGQ